MCISSTSLPYLLSQYTDKSPRPSTVTRTVKQNDRDHAGIAAGTASIEEHLPRYFAKSGHIDVDPKKVKKEGGGKGNWFVIIANSLFTLCLDRRFFIPSLPLAHPAFRMTNVTPHFIGATQAKKPVTMATLSLKLGAAPTAQPTPAASPTSKPNSRPSKPIPSSRRPTTVLPPTRMRVIL